jgi:SAM-dependent methyltransferase
MPGHWRGKGSFRGGADNGVPMPTPSNVQKELQRFRRSRLHPRITQFDYLHLQRLLEDLRRALKDIPGQVEDVLDVFCGSRPYEELLPAGAKVVGLDVEDRYGVVDVVSDEFLPFEDESFDLVICIEGFHYVPDSAHGVSEISRVLRPGGSVLIAVPLIWHYDRTILERRFTGPELAALFDDWDHVEVIENGGMGVSWALLTGHLFYLREKLLPPWLRRIFAPLFKSVYAVVNAIGSLIESRERRRLLRADPNYTLPPNLILTARRPER